MPRKNGFMKNKNDFSEAKCRFHEFRTELIEILPCLLSKVTDEYKDFVISQTSTDVKSFAAYQAACRTALTHLQLLIKISMWAEPAASGETMIDDAESDLDQLIMDARRAIQETIT